MNVILLNKGEGKTEALIRILKQNRKTVLLVFCQSERKRLMQDHGVPDNLIFTWDDHVLRGLPADVEFLIDDVDQFLYRLTSGRKIKAITITNDGKNEADMERFIPASSYLNEGRQFQTPLQPRQKKKSAKAS